MLPFRAGILSEMPDSGPPLSFLREALDSKAEKRRLEPESTLERLREPVKEEELCRRTWLFILSSLPSTELRNPFDSSLPSPASELVEEPLPLRFLRPVMAPARFVRLDEASPGMVMVERRGLKSYHGEFTKME